MQTSLIATVGKVCETECVKRIRLTESFRQIYALVSLARIFQTINFFLIDPVVPLGLIYIFQHVGRAQISCRL